ncbi:hypothetical protein [Acinetobacter sp. TR11]|uniref:hypothetical protein n=1 Tax=Acinetobacter sp. TR11 TaxID=3003393 RepID=UPI0022AC886F|nr:hypothetical protein [Acinetobacter sp. TR11]WAU72898.1 hypothetical protein O1450_12505 [Acinetobacter sp. TR11]
MSIPSSIRTPDTYMDVNLNAQRSGLPANIHRILFITDDVQPDSTAMPISIYDKAQANTIFGGTAIAPAEASRMITAAVKTNRIVDVQVLGKSLPVEI